MATPSLEGSFLKKRAVESARTITSVFVFHSIVTSPWSRMNILPSSFGSDSVAFSIVACILKPVVAPQLREKRTILFTPSGETDSEATSLLHGSEHPTRRCIERQTMHKRDICSANVPDEESPLASGMSPAREADSAGDMPEVPKGRGFALSVRWDYFRNDRVVET